MVKFHVKNILETLYYDKNQLFTLIPLQISRKGNAANGHWIVDGDVFASPKAQTHLFFKVPVYLRFPCASAFFCGCKLNKVRGVD